MNTIGATGPWRRRARPLLGTLVDRSLPPAAEELLADLEAAVRRYAP